MQLQLGRFIIVIAYHHHRPFLEKASSFAPSSGRNLTTFFY